MTHLPQSELTKRIEVISSKIKVGSYYCHYKSPEKSYKVLNLAIIEESEEVGVIYQAQYDDKITFIRPASIWLEEVDWNGKMVPRFSEISR